MIEAKPMIIAPPRSCTSCHSLPPEGAVRLWPGGAGSTAPRVKTSRHDRSSIPFVLSLSKDGPPASDRPAAPASVRAQPVNSGGVVI